MLARTMLLLVGSLGSMVGLLLTVVVTLLSAIPAGLYGLLLFLFWRRG